MSSAIYRAPNNAVVQVASGLIKVIEVSGASTFECEGGIGMGDSIIAMIQTYGAPDFVGTDSSNRGVYLFPDRALQVWTQDGTVTIFNITRPNFNIPGPIALFTRIARPLRDQAAPLF